MSSLGKRSPVSMVNLNEIIQLLSRCFINIELWMSSLLLLASILSYLLAFLHRPSHSLHTRSVN